ncbi:major capsid protein [uncultured Paraglaciecola sp.]|uniref:major capsid protein n=1 Tax=uncultured Paraglaciecola sp. TaxID=1765024 RepID=UPI0026368813|nr:major capsid protein [uncultured Paraglaciecola sp.]
MPTNPTPGDVHVNVPLTNFSQKYLQDESNFISLRAMPNLPVGKQSDLYYEFNKGDFWRVQDTARANATESGGGGFRLSTSPYFANVNAWHKDVSDRDRATSDSQIALDNSATQYVSQILMITREIQFAAAFMTPGNWTTAVNKDWSSASSDPIADVKTGKRTIQGLTGIRPNKMIFGRQAWDTLTDNDAMLSRITGGANNALPAMVMRTLVAQLFEIDEIFVMDAVKNTAIEGAADAISFIGGDDVLLYYAPNSVSLDEPTAGVVFSWTGFLGATSNGIRIKRFRNEAIESDRIEGQMSYDQKLTAADLGYMFTTVSAA